MNNQIKALWMAKYVGQVVYRNAYWQQDVATEELWFGTLNFLSNISQGILLLRTVDMLTNEETKIIRESHNWPEITDVRLVLSNRIKGNSLSSEFQYLLRIGILLPFTYLNEDNQPITLTPDEIIALGWAKIKTT